MNVLGLLIPHQGMRQVILRNSLWLGLGVGVSSLVDFSVAVYITRVLGPAEYGKFTFAFAFANLFAALLDFGLTTAVTREFARDQTNARYFADILSLKGLLGLVVLPLIAAAGWLVAPDSASRVLVLTLGVYLFLLEAINLLYGSFRARQRMDAEAAIRMLQSLLLVGFVVAAMRLRGSVTAVGLAYVAAAATTLLVATSVVLMRPRLRLPLRPTLRPPVLRTFAAIGIYLAMMRIAGDIMTNIDSVILGSRGFLEATGWYNAAAKVNGLALFPMGLVTTAVFPALVSMQRTSVAEFVRTWETWLRGTVVFAGLIAGLILTGADGIVAALYPASFGPAALALKILIFKAVLVYLHNVYYHLLLVFDQQHRLFVVVLTALGLNIGLNLLLIPRFSLYGAAMAAVIAHGAILVLYLVLMVRHTSVRPLSRSVLATSFAAAAAGALTYATFALTNVSRLNLLVSLAIGAILYGVAFLSVSRLQRVFVPV